MILQFDRIRLRDGRSSEFTGVLQAARAPNGDTILVDSEGVARYGAESSRSDQAIERGALGAAIGAIIGAIAGGGKGAAIGAGTGAGTVYVQGRDQLNLPAGSELTILTTSQRSRHAP